MSTRTRFEKETKEYSEMAIRDISCIYLSAGRREGSKLIGFKVKSVIDSNLQFSARLIAITAEHMDTLITDWFPGLDNITVQGHRLVTRLIPCAKCIMAVCGVGEEEIKKPNTAEATGVTVGLSSQDSAIHLSTTDGSSASASPWPSPVHNTRKIEENGEGIYLGKIIEKASVFQESTLYISFRLQRENDPLKLNVWSSE